MPFAAAALYPFHDPVVRASPLLCWSTGLAAAFFLLASDVEAAARVCSRQLADVQLAIVIARLHEAEAPELLGAIVEHELLPHAEAEADAWLVAVSHMLLGRPLEAVRTISAAGGQTFAAAGDSSPMGGAREAEGLDPKTSLRRASSYEPGCRIAFVHELLAAPTSAPLREALRAGGLLAEVAPASGGAECARGVRGRAGVMLPLTLLNASIDAAVASGSPALAASVVRRVPKPALLGSEGARACLGAQYVYQRAAALLAASRAWPPEGGAGLREVETRLTAAAPFLCAAADEVAEWLCVPRRTVEAETLCLVRGSMWGAAAAPVCVFVAAVFGSVANETTRPASSALDEPAAASAGTVARAALCGSLPDGLSASECRALLGHAAAVLAAPTLFQVVAAGSSACLHDGGALCVDTAASACLAMLAVAVRLEECEAPLSRAGFGSPCRKARR